MFGIKIPVVPDTTTPGAFRVRVEPVPPSSVPAVLVQVPENVCDNPLPRLSVPPVPLIVRPTPLTALVNVATPADLIIDTVPVVVKPFMDWAAAPENDIPPVPGVNVPEIERLPPKVNIYAPCVKVALLLMIKGTLSVRILASFRVMAPVPANVIPLDPLNDTGHSEDAVLAELPVYWSEPFGP